MQRTLSRFLPRSSARKSRCGRSLPPFVTTTTNKSLSTRSTSVPIIDFGPFDQPSGSAEKEKVVQEVREACENVGFLAVANHGVDPKIISEMWDQTRSFFDEEESVKVNGTEMTSDYPYGFIPFGGETLRSGRDQELGSKNDVAPADLNESFAIGPDRPVLEGKYVLPPLKWPRHRNAEQFREAWLAYYGAMEQLSSRLLRCFALSLNLEEYWFEDKIGNHRAALRALNYPDLAEEFRPAPGQMRASAHTDYGSLTILLQEASPGGLQVRPIHGTDKDTDPEEGWVPCPVVPGTFVVNLGDLMRRWTNDRWASTLHRVVVPPVDKQGSARRQSIAFFHNINPETRVTAIPTTVPEGEQPLYDEITAHDFLLNKHMAATGQVSDD